MSEEGFVQIALDDAKEPEVAPEGAYDLVIDQATWYTGKTSGKKSIRCIILFDGHPEYQPIFHYVSIPNENDDSEMVGKKLLMVKRFLTLFGVPFDGSGFNVDDLPGQRALCNVQQENDGVNPASNKIAVPRMVD